jgi:Retron-type reverse transcriptase
VQVLRYWDYYNMTEIFTDLHERARRKECFNDLYGIIISKENVLLAYRSIKSNKGSHTPGTDGITINDLKRLSEEEVVQLVQELLLNYRPKQVRRVFIPKPNGKKRPLGIPCMMDRIIQQCFKQVLEPIAEAWFYKHSYGFRPLRSTHFALARVQQLINRSGLHYVVDIDIKGFFDNVNHTLLIKQLWNMGIRDRIVLRIISKMLKAEIKGEGIPAKGTPQGGILSPLLSNIVLNDLDQWIVGQWENFQTDYSYFDSGKKVRAMKTTNLKEGYIVRYADDFKILCRDWKTAQKWFHAARLYLQDRLKLEISPDKSQIVNLRKRKSEFLGFTIWATKKRKSRVAYTGISKKKQQQLKDGLKERINKIRLSPTTQNALLYNSFVMGIHNYFKRATHVNKEFARIAYELKTFIYNRLIRIGKYGHPSRPPPTYSKFYSTNYKTFLICGVYLYPIADVQMRFNTYLFNPELSLFTEIGRERIHKKLRPDIQFEVTKLMQSSIPDRSIEYKDNRISRYSMKMGKCEITGIYLLAEDVHCHHYRPLYLGGTDKFDNLRILHKEVHGLIHASNKETIRKLMNKIGITENMVEQINKYREASNMELIDLMN